MQNLALLYREMKHFEKSILIFEDVIKIRKEIASEDQGEMAVCKMGLSGCLREIQKFKESEKEIDETLEIFLKIYGENNVLTGRY